MRPHLPILLLILSLLLAPAAPLRADGPAFIQKSGVFGRVVEVKSNYLVEWYNTTQHALKINFTLTLEDNRTREGTSTIQSKQRLEDPNTKSAAKIIRIQITKIQTTN